MIGPIRDLYDPRYIEELCSVLPADARAEAAAGVQVAVLNFEISLRHENREITREYIDDWSRRLSAVQMTKRTLEQNTGFFASGGAEIRATLDGLARMERDLALMLDHWRSIDRSRGLTSSAEHEAIFIVQIGRLWASANGLDFESVPISESPTNKVMTFIERVVGLALSASGSRKCGNLPRHIKETVYRTRTKVTA